MITFFRLTHEYDIGDRSLYFTFDESKIEETAKELAVFLQFKAEEMFDNSICLDHQTIIKFLALFGAEQIESKPTNVPFNTIDMYWDRERSCGDWYKGSFGELDKKYSDKAIMFLKSEADDNQLMGELD
ncbi:hypothetical protein [Vibrio tritonius]|uniref:hypothetical protein n=1 Tax=Vibrio tritonius TaxID=1435069 RepID=UPI00315DEAD8